MSLYIDRSQTALKQDVFNMQSNIVRLDHGFAREPKLMIP